MTSPTVNSESDINEPEASPWQMQSKQLPLWVRRCGAWAAEVSLIVISGLVPYSIGALCNRGPQFVPLNPLLSSTTQTLARTFALPNRARSQPVAPLTNLFWSMALVIPVGVAGWQLFLLANTGQTLPKRWMKVRVMAELGMPPGFAKVFIREYLGRWGLPMGAAYFLWHISGAYPALGILVGLGGLLMVGDGMMARLDPKSRTGHDRLSGTLVEDVLDTPYTPFLSPELAANAATAPIRPVVPPTKKPLNLWLWMRQHPGLTLLMVSLAGMTSILGTFVGTQIYIQKQANSREFKQQDNQVFLTIVNQISSTSPSAVAERRVAILALGAGKDPRAVPFLVDLLAQEENPSLLGVIEQALVSSGTKSLPELRRLNMEIGNELDSLQSSGNTKEQQVAAMRQRSTQRAMAKILKVYSGFLQDADLSGVNLGQVVSGPNSFTLVLDKTDLSGIRLRSATLSRGSFQGSRFQAAGTDGRLGTFDDILADLSGADFTEANFTNANLSYAILQRTNLFGATLNKANLSNAQATGINFSSAKLIGANLQQALLKDAKFTGADLGSANLSDANLEGARLGQVKAEAAQLESANLKQSNWQGANLSGANLSRANLEAADLSAAQLNGANLKNANLQDANFRNADLGLAELQGAELDGADFKGAKFAISKTTPSNLLTKNQTSKAENSRLQGVDFTGTKNLEPNQISYICSQGGTHPKCP